MSTTTAVPPEKKVNRIGLEQTEYRGGKTTLCAGCGHNSISERIVECFYEMGVDPTRVVKLSGIGCSSKSPAYFLNLSHGFNAVHGRMPSVATGAVLANKDLLALGVTGDGDTASIGIGQFVHLMRRNLPIIYIIEDNGCYGLTKGQFSATADKGSKSKTAVNHDAPIDLVSMALVLGASFVGRGFSGDKKQLVPLLKAAIAHQGSAILDVISPCVQFNNNPQSTKSYDFVREHNEAVNRVDFIETRKEITADYAPGTVEEVRQHDGSVLRLAKLHEDYDPHDRAAAIGYLQDRHARGEIVTGLLYLDKEAQDLHGALNTVTRPLNRMGEKELCPGAKTLETINASYR